MLDPFRIVVSLTLIVVVFGVCSVSVNAQSEFTKVRAALKEKYEIKQFRFFYDTTGQHAIDTKDVNENKVPDQIENVAKQTWAAHKLFVDTLGFPDPLESDRYKNAKYVDVNFLSRKTVGRKATAYDELQRFRRPNDPDDLRTLCYDISSDVDASKDSTPTHEYFHLIHNSQTYFKTRWFTEGMARWSEHATEKLGVGRIGYHGSWPQSENKQQQLFNLSDPYGSEFTLWNPLAKLADRSGKIDPKRISKTVRSLRYSNGEPVLNDTKLNGSKFMIDVLEELSKMDDVAFKEMGYKKWTEANQKSLKNSPYVYLAIMNAAKRNGIKVRDDK